MKRGQVLIEMLLALSVVTVVLVALAGVATRSISNSTFARNQAQAGRLAREAMEYIYSYSRQDGNVFFDFVMGDGYCFKELNFSSLKTPDKDCEIIIDGVVFIRRVDVTWASGGGKQVTVTVGWNESGRAHNVSQKSVLTQY